MPIRRSSRSSSTRLLALIGVVLALAAPAWPRAVAQPPTGGAPAPAEAPALSPPRIVHSEPPVYPASGAGEHPTVVVRVVVGTDGTVTEATVEHSAGEEFDAAALEAVRRYRFEPARRGEQPIPSRIRIAVHFELPSFDVPSTEVPGEAHGDDGHGAHFHDVPAAAGEAPRPRADTPEPTEGEDEEPALVARAEVELESLRAGDRSASDFTANRAVLELAPHRDAGEMLRVAPGMFVSRPEGDAVAHRIMLRGFDAEHGQDLELSLGGIPLNQPSHIHGQGYADLGFVIPELVRSVRVIEGVYDPRQGDFAVAGSADFELGVNERGLRFESSMGSFGTFRQLAMWAPEGHEDDTFAAVQVRRTRGFGERRAGASSSGMVQYGFGEGAWRFRLLGAFHGARSDIAGVVRRDDVAAGSVGFYEAYDVPTARAQNAFALRTLLAVVGEHRGPDGSNADFAVWMQWNDFRSQQNFTGFVEQSWLEPAWAGRGDLVEQTNRATSFGLRARHRTRAYEPFSFARARFELGLAARADRIEQAQNLLAAPQNETWDRRVDARIEGGDIGVWADVDLALGERVSLRGGVRADALFYDVDDRLGNFIPAYRREDYILGHRRSAFGVAAGPRVTLEVRAADPLRLMFAYGEGYRSPQARMLEDGERAPYTKVRSADAGARLVLGDDEQVRITATGFFTQLSDDVAFDPGEARLERIGPTRRLGAVLHASAEPIEGLLGAFSVTWVHATLLEPPPASASDPTPAFEEGQLLPYVPPVVVRLDLGARRKLAELGGDALEGRIGLGFSYVGRRPLPYAQRAEGIPLLDASASLHFRAFDLGLTATNLLDRRWAASEYLYVSNWDPGSPASRIPAKHVAAGAPRTVLFTLGVSL